MNVQLVQLKALVGFDALGDQDKNDFNKMASQARAIAAEWRFLEEATRQGFVGGSIPYSKV